MKTRTQRTTEQHHALGSAASYPGGQPAGVAVDGRNARMAGACTAPSTGFAPTFGDCNHPRRLVGFGP